MKVMFAEKKFFVPFNALSYNMLEEGMLGSKVIEHQILLCFLDPSIFWKCFFFVWYEVATCSSLSCMTMGTIISSALPLSV